MRQQNTFLLIIGLGCVMFITVLGQVAAAGQIDRSTGAVHLKSDAGLAALQIPCDMNEVYEYIETWSFSVPNMTGYATSQNVACAQVDGTVHCAAPLNDPVPPGDWAHLWLANDACAAGAERAPVTYQLEVCESSSCGGPVECAVSRAGTALVACTPGQ